MVIKIKIQNKFYILYFIKGENKKKKQFSKMIKKNKKNEGQNWHKNKNNVCD